MNNKEKLMKCLKIDLETISIFIDTLNENSKDINKINKINIIYDMYMGSNRTYSKMTMKMIKFLLSEPYQR